MERNVHGFKFEDQIKTELGITEEKSYTAKWDIGEDLSVKYISDKGSVDCGSIVRGLEALTNPPFRMILGRHKNKKCTAVYELEFTEEICNALKGELTLKDVTDMDKFIRTFPRGKHMEARAWVQERKFELENTFTFKLSIRPKIDSRSQRRIQWSINNTTLKNLFSLKPSKKFEHLIGVSFA